MRTLLFELCAASVRTNFEATFFRYNVRTPRHCGQKLLNLTKKTEKIYNDEEEFLFENVLLIMQFSRPYQK